MCNCGNTITTNTICTTCTPNDCACPIKDFSTDCILYTGEDLPCTGINKGTILTELITQLDTYICTLQTQIINSSRLINVGEGTRVYRGVDGIGRKEIRSIVSTDSIITIGLSTDDKEIEIGLDTLVLKDFIQANQITYSVSNIGTGAGVYKEAIRTGDNVDFKLRKIKSTQASFSIVESEDDIVITTDGSETKVQQGSGVSVTGIGTFVSPYVVTNTAPNIPVSIAQGSGISVTGAYPNFTVTNTLPDQTVSITGGGTTTVTGTYPNFTISSTGGSTTYSAGSGISIVGTIISNTSPDVVVSITGSGATTVTGTYPNFTVSSTDNNTTYSAGAGLALSGTTFSVENLQKVITYPTDFTGTNYTLTSADNHYEIIINNGATAVTITVPSGLPSKIGVGFTQKGTGDVTYIASGTTINNPIGLKIKGQYYQTFLSQELATNNYFLGGNTKA